MKNARQKIHRRGAKNAEKRRMKGSKSKVQGPKSRDGTNDCRLND